ncbi:MAG: leucine-rich repeat protein [Lachnospiraceae bacterium]|jgi:hypothetical protein|nr:leucine-rich repeat protein [Lachnospiraceae bacterium]
MPKRREENNLNNQKKRNHAIASSIVVITLAVALVFTQFNLPANALHASENVVKSEKEASDILKADGDKKDITTSDKTDEKATNDSQNGKNKDDKKDASLDNPENNPFLPQLLNKDNKEKVVLNKKKSGKKVKSSALITTDDYEFNPDTGNLLIKTTAGLTSFTTDSNIDQTQVTSVSFGDNMTSIPDAPEPSYFSDTKVTSIDFNNVTTIGKNAFYKNNSLVNINLSKVSSIGSAAFQECSSLSSLDLPSGGYMGQYLFYGCDALQKVNFPDDLSSLPNGCFEDCDGLETIDLNNVTEIGPNAFGGCKKLRNINLSKVESISIQSFRECSLESIDISSVTSIDDFAFQNCSHLFDVKLPSSAKYGKQIFVGCAFDLSEGYPTGTSLTTFSNPAQTPKIFFSLDNYSSSIDCGDKYNEPQYSLKSKTGADYASLIASKPEWLSTSATVPDVTKSGDTIDTNTPGTYTITYSIPDTYYADNNTLTYTLTVKDNTPINASITPDTAVFDKTTGSEDYDDVSVNLNSGSHSLLSIDYNDYSLVEGNDYTKHENKYTIKKEYLEKLDEGDHSFIFKMSGGTNPQLIVYVVRNREVNASVTPKTAGFDKNKNSKNHKDIQVLLDPAVYQTNGIKNGSYTLVKGKDYSVKENKPFVDNSLNKLLNLGINKTSYTNDEMDDVLYLIRDDYLDTLKPGTHKLTFDVSSGVDPVLTINVSDTTKKKDDKNDGKNDGKSDSDKKDTGNKSDGSGKIKNINSGSTGVKSGDYANTTEGIILIIIGLGLLCVVVRRVSRRN